MQNNKNDLVLWLKELTKNIVIEVLTKSFENGLHATHIIFNILEGISRILFNKYFR